MDDVSVFLGETKIGEIKPFTLKVENEVHHIPDMEYYMRRGNKYFLRCKRTGQKITFQAEGCVNDMPKRGTIVACNFTTE